MATFRVRARTVDMLGRQPGDAKVFQLFSVAVGIDVAFVPEFVNVEIDGKVRTAIKFVVDPK